MYTLRAFTDYGRLVREWTGLGDDFGQLFVDVLRYARVGPRTSIAVVRVYQGDRLVYEQTPGRRLPCTL